jgi:hypothetical protein
LSRLNVRESGAVQGTSGKVHDVVVLNKLPHGEEGTVFGDWGGLRPTQASRYRMGRIGSLDDELFRISPGRQSIERSAAFRRAASAHSRPAGWAV